MTDSNADLARAFAGAIAAGDLEAAAQHVTDDVVFRFPGRSALAGEVRGKDAWLAWFARAGELIGARPEVELVDVLASDERAAAVARLHLERRGRSLDWTRVIVYGIRGGKISEIWVHDSDQYALDELLA